MNIAEVDAALKANDGHQLKVVTKAGVEYWLEQASLDVYRDLAYPMGLGEKHFVYGFRVKPKLCRRMKRLSAGTIKWFNLENVKLVDKGE